MSKIYYSPSIAGFLWASIVGKNLPADAVEVSAGDHQRLLAESASGKVIAVVDGQAVLQNPPAPTLGDLRDAKISEVNMAFEQAAAALTAGYPEAERLTWPVQQAEALAWGADSNAPTPYLDGLATARGIDPDDMRQKTLTQTQLFMAASQQLVGKRQRLRDLVYEAESPGELDAIQWDEPAA